MGGKITVPEHFKTKSGREKKEHLSLATRSRRNQHPASQQKGGNPAARGNRAHRGEKKNLWIYRRLWPDTVRRKGNRRKLRVPKTRVLILLSKCRRSQTKRKGKMNRKGNGVHKTGVEKEVSCFGAVWQHRPSRERRGQKDAAGFKEGSTVLARKGRGRGFFGLECEGNKKEKC